MNVSDTMKKETVWSCNMCVSASKRERKRVCVRACHHERVNP